MANQAGGSPASHITAQEPEVEHLRTENENLRRDIETWKMKLTQAEIAHGKPVFTAVKPPVVAPIAEDAKTTKAPTASGDENSAPKPEKEKKEAKTEKKKKEVASTPAEVEGPVDVGRLDLRVGHIRSAKKHPDADSLYVEEVRSLPSL